MKKQILTLLVLIGILIPVTAQKSDQEMIKEVIQTAYIDGLVNTGNQEAIRSGFHPGFNLLGIGEGDRMWKRPIYDWAEAADMQRQKGELPRTGDDKVSVKFLNIDVEGTAAVAKVEFYTGNTLRYIDFLSLYKFESGWKIVGKIFYQIPEKK
jgi:hypothetical protein